MHDCLRNAETLLGLLRAWTREGWIRPVDLALAATLHQRRPDTPAPALLAAALTSQRAGHGHLLLDLDTTLRHPETVIPVTDVPAGGIPPIHPHAVLEGLSLEDWIHALASSQVAGSGPGSEPLVLEGKRLYLRRYWRHEETITQHIAARLSAPVERDEHRVRELLVQLFPPPRRQPEGAQWQKLACALAARSRFAVITGGPGTGKTTTVIRLLALLQALALESPDPRPLRIRLAAPTGKAAARLNESIAAQVDQLDLAGLHHSDGIRAAIPTAVTTLHRLLGARPDTRRFAYNRLRPLPLDLVVVDEASMIDVEMMSALLEALPPAAGLVLLGDKDQLASVEAGAVLGSLCSRAAGGQYTPATRDWLQRVADEQIDDTLVDIRGRPLDQAVSMLRHSHRFAADSGIGALARAINDGDSARTRDILTDDRYQDLHCIPLTGPDTTALLQVACDGHSGQAPGYRHPLEVMHARRPADDAPRETLDAWAAAVLAAQTGFQLLCALRRGAWGVDQVNLRIQAHLARQGLITPPDTGHWYEGRPVLVTGNDYGLRLMNGDIGIALNVPVTPGDPENGKRLRVAFPGEQGTIRWVLPSRLQHCETVYAMTVHKSQGSEFRHTALVLPDTAGAVVTRELVYTAVTRAARHFTLLLPDPAVLEAAIGRPTQRASGLFPAIPGTGG
ncbi:MAG: exodeoxyribonuclease V subunit alpha [Ectothiorhodospiraceae bacterium]|nr:exodeoxyribonuclease V subunit alpha [Ectothiorhodospiraceae bacterium]